MNLEYLLKEKNKDIEIISSHVGPIALRTFVLSAVHTKDA